MSTTLITNGIVVDAGTMRPLDILISGERVESLLPRGSEVRADRVIDASGRYVLPGIIDAHNHPVYADRIDRLSRAALSGGVTTVIPYIGAVAAWGKQGGLVQAIDDFIREGETGSCIDFGLHCTLTANVMEEADEAIPELVARGVISFKAFTSYRKRGMKLEDDQILHLMELVAREKALLAFHAENDAILEYLEAKAVAEGREHPRDYPATHPNISEAEAIFRVLSLASVAGCNIYLPHVTCKESLEAIRLFRKWGTVPTLFAETCPHYLTLDDSQLALRGNLAKMSPPLRKEADREALWEAIRNGEIQVVASDAAGHATAANEPLFAETFRAPHGAPAWIRFSASRGTKGLPRAASPSPTLCGSCAKTPRNASACIQEREPSSPDRMRTWSSSIPATTGSSPTGTSTWPWTTACSRAWAASAGIAPCCCAAQSPMRTGRSSTTPGAAFSCAAACPPNGAPTLKEKAKAGGIRPALAPYRPRPAARRRCTTLSATKKGSGPPSQRKGGAAMPPSGK